MKLVSTLLWQLTVSFTYVLAGVDSNVGIGDGINVIVGGG